VFYLYYLPSYPVLYLDAIVCARAHTYTCTYARTWCCSATMASIILLQFLLIVDGFFAETSGSFPLTQGSFAVGSFSEI